MAEGWEAHMHLSVGKHFEMYFDEFNKVRRFRVLKNSGGLRTAMDIDTGEEFEFSGDTLYKSEYSTLREIEP